MNVTSTNRWYWLKIVLGFPFSPTRVLVSVFKKEKAPSHNKKILTWFNWGYFGFEIIWCFAIIWYCHKLDIAYCNNVATISIIYAYSRIIEIVYAFGNDAKRQLKGEDPTSNLKRYDRVVMAMRSYSGLTINFALLYFFLPIPIEYFFSTQVLFKCPLNNFFESLYFSGVTITTLGYGDILPVHWVSRLLVLFEVYAGIFLIVVAVGSYLGDDGASNKK